MPSTVLARGLFSAGAIEGRADAIEGRGRLEPDVGTTGLEAAFDDMPSDVVGLESAPTVGRVETDDGLGPRREASVLAAWGFDGSILVDETDWEDACCGLTSLEV